MIPLDLPRALSVCAVGATIAVATGWGGSGSGYGDDAPTGPTAPAWPPSTTAGSTVQATPQNTFTPREVAIGTGATVTWAFGSVAHNVTFAAAAAGAGSGGEYGGASGGGSPSNVPTTANASVSRAFSAAGTYGYECTIHPGVTGTVTVR